MFLVVIKSVKGFLKDGGMNLSAAISFYALLSIFPFILLVFSLLDKFMGIDDQSMNKSVELARNFIPQLPTETVYRLKELVHQGDSRFVTLVGALLLLWMAQHVFSSLQFAVNSIFRTRSGKNVWLGKVKSFLMIFIIFGLLLLSFVMNSVFAFMKGFYPQLMSKFFKFIEQPFILAYLIPALGAFLMFSLFFKTVPHTKVKWKHAFTGSFICTILWEIAKHLFGIYVERLPTYGILFGSMATTVVFLLWIYYSSCILLLGAEMVAILNGNRKN